MSEINALKDKINTKTVNLVLLTIATAGIFPLLWLYRNAPIISEETGKQITDNNFIIWIAAFIGLGGVFSTDLDPLLALIGSLISLVGSILYIIWGFKAKSALQEYALEKHNLNLKLNWFYTLLFTVYYINYCINDLPEDLNKQNSLTPNGNPIESAS